MSDEQPRNRVVIPCEEFESRRKAREWRRWSLLQELLRASDAHELANVRELAETPRRRRGPA
jgi:hypothetical protein